jgi:hypothetical protein
MDDDNGSIRVVWFYPQTELIGRATLVSSLSYQWQEGQFDKIPDPGSRINWAIR